MIFDTAGVDCNIIRENELGIYDTQRVVATWVVKYGNQIYVKVKNSKQDIWLTIPKERVELCVK